MRVICRAGAVRSREIEPPGTISGATCRRTAVNTLALLCYTGMRGTVRRGSIQVRLVGLRPVGLRLHRGLRRVVWTAVLAASVAGCSFNTDRPPTPTVDPNLMPQNYRKQIAVYLSTELLDRADFRGARIAPPALKPVGGSRRPATWSACNSAAAARSRAKW